MSDHRNVVVAIALRDEAQGLFEREGIDVLYVGLGKINAAYRLTRELARHDADRLPLVVNFGTAGSRKFKTGSVVACDRFVQRDMDVRGLGFPLGTTPFDEMEAVIEHAKTFTHLPHATCGTGDSFETSGPAIESDVVDMEAYALAKVCRAEGARFACAKYVTDGADQSAAHDWQSNLPNAAAAFVELYRWLVRSVQT